MTEADPRAELDAVRRHLRIESRAAIDRQTEEDLAQGAYVELLEARAAGKKIDNPVAWMKRAAWRDFLDSRKVKQAEPHDPQALVFANATAAESDGMAERSDIARLNAALQQLPKVKQHAYRLRVIDEWPVAKICEALKIPRSTFYLYVSEAKKVAEDVWSREDLEPGTRDLLGRYALGLVERLEELRAVKHLLKNDAVALARYRELCDLHRGAAAALPAPALDQVASLGDRLGAAFQSLRDRLPGGGGQPEEVAGALAASGGGRAAGAGGAGVLALLGGSGAKLAVGCLAAGGITAACIATGVLPGGGSEETRAKSPEAARERTTAPAANLDRLAAATNTEPKVTPKRESTGGGGEETTSAPAPAPAPTSAPTESDVAGQTGTPAPAPAPAAAPTSSEVNDQLGLPGQ